MTAAFLAAVICGCGEPGEVASMGATLLIPRQLAGQLKGVEIFLFEIKALHPNCDELGEPASFENWRGRAFASHQIDFSQIQKAVFDGIPDRGTVWSFFARGYDAAALLIAQGCDGRVYRVQAGKDIDVTLEIRPYP